jgi:uncharacterized repeat protein (TIGR03803 family)
MFRNKALSLLTATFVFSLGLSTLAASAFAVPSEQILYSFCPASGCSDGEGPFAPLIFDAAGNLYGTTEEGGAYGSGMVFELSPGVHGGWTEKVLHSFNNDGTDGYSPTSGLVFDAAGNLYGTTTVGGVYDWGSVFELVAGVGGQWTEHVLHSFQNDGNDGTVPFLGTLIFDGSGNLYGTTTQGGGGQGCTFGCGTVFELTPGANGQWTEKILHRFVGDDGSQPQSGLIWDTHGNLYGTTWAGGTAGFGAVFELSPGVNGEWQEKVLHSFLNNDQDGTSPLAALIFDANGNLYGTTKWGGTGGAGTVFELMRVSSAASAQWPERVLHSFQDNGADGFLPYASLAMDAAGNLYGTTYDGGASRSCGAAGCGTVFVLVPNMQGQWIEHLLHSFSILDGSNPLAGLIFDPNGNLYGTTGNGGSYGGGTVFEIVP